MWETLHATRLRNMTAEPVQAVCSAIHTHSHTILSRQISRSCHLQAVAASGLLGLARPIMSLARQGPDQAQQLKLLQHTVVHAWGSSWCHVHRCANHRDIQCLIKG